MGESIRNTELKPARSLGIEKKEGRARKMVTNDKKVRCPRCDGAMVFERFQDMLTLFYSWRCVNCGEIVDPVVSKNREPARGAKKKAVGE
jgi:DNA-directed RNA polymerase subunit RPC12/RpoP